MATDLRRILIVDDSIEDRFYVKRLLTRTTGWEWEFIEASKGAEALAILGPGSQFDCILLDYRLPDMNGGEFLERLRDRHGEPGFATVVIAGTGDESVAVRAMKLGAQDYLSKSSLTSDFLFHAVENAISRFQLTLTNLRSSKALAESEERYRGLVESIPHIVWTVTPEGTLNYANSNWFKFLGFPSYDFSDSGWPDLSHTDDGKQFSDAWKSGLSSGRLFEIEHRLPQRGTTGLRWYLSRAVPTYDDAGHLIKWFGTSTDIEDRKKAELAVLEAQKLESIGLLAGGIAHDFNNLLVGILGGASYIVAELPASHPLQTVLEGIVSAGERAAFLTRQMLAYAGKGNFFIEQVNINELIQSTYLLIQASISKQVPLTFNIRQDLPPVDADSSQMQQIIMNLVLNAAEASEAARSQVTITTNLLDLDAQVIAETKFVSGALDPGSYVVFEVQDNGIGMDQDTRAKIFDPFFTTKFTGRGLGLSAVQGILRAHKGAIELKTELGKGSTFRVFLPASLKKIVAPATILLPTNRLPTNRGQGTILVIDDEDIIRKTIKVSLEYGGFQVLLAKSGEQAIDLLLDKETLPILLIVLDMNMPGLSGKETMQRLRFHNVKVPILICSGYSDSEIGLEFSGLDIAGFINKPFTFRQLMSKINSIQAASEPTGTLSGALNTN